MPTSCRKLMHGLPTTCDPWQSLRGNIGRRGVRIAAIDGAVGPHRMHDHASLRATATTALRCPARLAINSPQVLTLSLRLKRVSSADAAS